MYKEHEEADKWIMNFYLHVKTAFIRISFTITHNFKEWIKNVLLNTISLTVLMCSWQNTKKQNNIREAK